MPCAVCRVGTDGERFLALLAGLAAVVDAASSNEQRGNGAACGTQGGAEVEKKGQRGEGSGGSMGQRTRCSKREKALPHDS